MDDNVFTEKGVFFNNYLLDTHSYSRLLFTREMYLLTGANLMLDIERRCLWLLCDCGEILLLVKIWIYKDY